jgi:hypothetical protein
VPSARRPRPSRGAPGGRPEPPRGTPGPPAAGSRGRVPQPVPCAGGAAGQRRPRPAPAAADGPATPARRARVPVHGPVQGPQARGKRGRHADEAAQGASRLRPPVRGTGRPVLAIQGGWPLLPLLSSPRRHLPLNKSVNVSTFQEGREYLKLASTQGYGKPTVLRFTPCICGLYTIIVLRYLQRPDALHAPAVLSWHGKSTVTFSDMLVCVRRAIWQQWLCQTPTAPTAFSILPKP